MVMGIWVVSVFSVRQKALMYMSRCAAMKQNLLRRKFIKFIIRDLVEHTFFFFLKKDLFIYLFENQHYTERAVPCVSSLPRWPRQPGLSEA